MANLVKTFLFEIAGGTAIFVLGIIFVIAGIMDLAMFVIATGVTGIALMVSILFKVIYNTKIVKNPMFLKDTKQIKEARIYVLDGEKLKVIDVIKNVEYMGNEGFIRKYKTRIQIDPKDLIISPKGVIADILIVAEHRAITIGEITIQEAENKKIKIVNALDEKYYRDRSERQLANLRNAELEAAKLSEQNKGMFEQIIGSGMMITIAAAISITMIVLSMSYAKDIMDKSLSQQDIVKSLSQSNQALAESINKRSDKELLYIKTIAKELGISLPQPAINETNKPKSAKDKLGEIITGG